MDCGDTLMTPNLRLNKKLTRYLNNIKLSDEDSVSMIGVEWNMNYGKHVLGCCYTSLFHNLLFFLQRTEDGQYRLIGGEKNCRFYIIDDIEAFIEHIGVCMLDLMFEFEEGKYEEVRHALHETQELPCQGIIVIEEGRAYVYEHYDY